MRGAKWCRKTKVQPSSRARYTSGQIVSHVCGLCHNVTISSRYWDHAGKIYLIKDDGDIGLCQRREEKNWWRTVKHWDTQWTWQRAIADDSENQQVNSRTMRRLRWCTGLVPCTRKNLDTNPCVLETPTLTEVTAREQQQQCTRSGLRTTDSQPQLEVHTISAGGVVRGTNDRKRYFILPTLCSRNQPKAYWCGFRVTIEVLGRYRYWIDKGDISRKIVIKNTLIERILVLFFILLNILKNIDQSGEGCSGS